MEQKTNQQHQAYTLYLQTEMTQEQIAELLNINRKTLYLWIKEGHWLRVKRSARYTPSMLADQYYRQLLAINDRIEMREEQPYPTKEESDVIRKLTLTIKQIKNKQTLNETLETLTMFMERLQQENMELAKIIGPYTIKYVSSLAEKGPIDKAIDDMQQDFILEREEDPTGVAHLPNVPHLNDEEDTTASGTNGASQTPQHIDPQYPDAPWQDANDEESEITPDENDAEDEDIDTTNPDYQPTKLIQRKMSPIPSDPYVTKHGNITVVKGKSSLMKRSDEERLNILHNPNSDKLKEIPNLWQSEKTAIQIRKKEEHEWNKRRISRY